MGKKVIFVVVDALASTVVEARMREGALPVLRRIGERGGLSECTAVFPSITPDRDRESWRPVVIRRVMGSRVTFGMTVSSRTSRTSGTTCG